MPPFVAVTLLLLLMILGPKPSLKEPKAFLMQLAV